MTIEEFKPKCPACEGNGSIIKPPQGRIQCPLCEGRARVEYWQLARFRLAVDLPDSDKVRELRPPNPNDIPF